MDRLKAKNLTYFFILMAVLWLCGCAKVGNIPITMPPNDSGRITLHMDPKLLKLKEYMNFKYGEGNVSTQSITEEDAKDDSVILCAYTVGKAIQTLFKDDPSSPVRLDYVSSRLSDHTSDFMILFATTTYRYDLSVILRAGGQANLIQGRGYSTKLSDAITQALIDVRNKVSALLRERND